MRKILVKTRFPGNHTRLCEYITALARIHTICCLRYSIPHQKWRIVRCLEFCFRYVYPYPLSSRFLSYYWSQSILNGPRLFKPDLGPFLLLFLTLNLFSFISPTQPIIIPTWYTSGLQCLNVRYNTIHSTYIVTPSVYSLTGRRWHEARPLEPLSMFPSKLYTLSEIQAKPWHSGSPVRYELWSILEHRNYCWWQFNMRHANCPNQPFWELLVCITLQAMFGSALRPMMNDYFTKTNDA